ncbi:tectonic-like complex member Mks1 [Drosophila kikkawai]|uniref:Tectonic-like complex member Mks1 n=1 Tax=Drosophila kikkawai TaxID=30033 RepID=A0A6P4JGC7_DROKI|nr:Meckel syndrome type 1 protein homolog [Drosophila kikkawai]
MQKVRDMKRTGVYRVSGNIGDFQLELKLRHISEWLPVPRFEYAGAQANATSGSEPYTEESEPWSDCRIYLPQGEDSYGVENRLGYYTGYCNVETGGSQVARWRRRSPAKQKALEGEPEKAGGVEENRRRRSSASQKVLEDEPEKALGVEEQEQLGNWSILSERNSGNPAGDLFYERNRELCNGRIASIRIAWQQKYLSHAELERHLPDPGGCATKLQRRYHTWALETWEVQQRHLQKLARARQEQEQDEDQDQARVRRRMRKSRRRQSHRPSTAVTLADGGPPSTVTAQGLSSASISEVSFDDPHFAARTCLIHTLVDGDAEDLLPPEARQLHLEGQQLMYVYADLPKDTLLVSIRYDPGQGLLYVYPDFSSSARDLDYMVQIERDNDCRQLYAFGFENATPLEGLLEEQPQPEDEEQQADDEAEYEDSRQELPEDATGLELVEYHHMLRLVASELRNPVQFEVPPKRMRRVCLLLELQTAQHFENANVHVRYYIQPPPNTLMEAPAGEDALCGATATCRNAGDWRLANLGHCWQLTLLCEEQHQPEQQLLHLYFEVVSIDSWQRERSEGYAHYSLPLISPLPTESIRLQCIRPLGSWLDALNRYFIGGRQLFDFVSYFDVQQRPAEIHSRLESNVRMAMRSTGSLLLRMQKLQQRQIDGAGHLFQLGDSDDAGGSGSSSDDAEVTSPEDATKATTLEEVMAAYVEARQRIESLLRSIADT